MAQMFTLRGINIGVRKSLAWQMLYHRASYIIPYSIMYYTFEHRTINHIARKFIADKGDKITSRCGFIYIGSEFNFHHEGISTASGCGKTVYNGTVFFIPGFHLHDGIPSACSHPGVVELMVYHGFSTTSNF